MPVPDQTTDWPAELHAAVREHGAHKVHRIGCQALGYPPYWAHKMTEFQTITRALRAH